MDIRARPYPADREVEPATFDRPRTGGMRAPHVTQREGGSHGSKVCDRSADPCRQRSLRQAALSPPRGRATKTRSGRRGSPRASSIEHKVNALLRKMTLDEKLQQLQLLSDGQITDDEAKAGVGGVFSLTDPAKIDHFQHVAVEQSRLHIPILFAYDTIHGYRTIFPIPLGDGQQLRSGRGHGRRHDRRARDRRGRHQADLQPDGRRLARAALGPHLRGRGRGPVPRLGDGGRARARRRRAPTTAPPTRSSRA